MEAEIIQECECYKKVEAKSFPVVNDTRTIRQYRMFSCKCRGYPVEKTRIEPEVLPACAPYLGSNYDITKAIARIEFAITHLDELTTEKIDALSSLRARINRALAPKPVPGSKAVIKSIANAA